MFFAAPVDSLLSCTCVESVVFAFLLHKAVMASALYYAAVLHYHDNVRILYRRQPVGYDEYRSVLHKVVHALLDYGLCSCIDG